MDLLLDSPAIRTVSIISIRHCPLLRPNSPLRRVLSTKTITTTTIIITTSSSMIPTSRTSLMSLISMINTSISTSMIIHTTTITLMIPPRPEVQSRRRSIKSLFPAMLFDPKKVRILRLEKTRHTSTSNGPPLPRRSISLSLPDPS